MARHRMRADVAGREICRPLQNAGSYDLQPHDRLPNAPGLEELSTTGCPVLKNARHSAVLKSCRTLCPRDAAMQPTKVDRQLGSKEARQRESSHRVYGRWCIAIWGREWECVNTPKEIRWPRQVDRQADKQSATMTSLTELQTWWAGGPAWAK